MMVILVDIWVYFCSDLYVRGCVCSHIHIGEIIYTYTYILMHMYLLLFAIIPYVVSCFDFIINT